MLRCGEQEGIIQIAGPVRSMTDGAQWNRWTRAAAAAAMLLAAASGGTSGQALNLDEVLFRASQAVVRFEFEFGNRMADERYEQRVVASDGQVKRNRRFGSELVFFRDARADTWTSFRNVREENGEPKGRDWLDGDVDSPNLGDFLRAATRRDQASTRRYIGDAPWSLHMPLLALTFLHPLNRHRSNFEKADEVTVDGRPVWVIRFSEHRRPPFVRVGGGGPSGGGRSGRVTAGDLFASGSFWIDPESGSVVKSDLVLGGSVSSVQARSHITVIFRQLAASELWVPAEMAESYDNPLFPDVDHLEGTATYANYRPLSLEPAHADESGR